MTYTSGGPIQGLPANASALVSGTVTMVNDTASYHQGLGDPPHNHDGWGSVHNTGGSAAVDYTFGSGSNANTQPATDIVTVTRVEIHAHFTPQNFVDDTCEVTVDFRKADGTLVLAATAIFNQGNAAGPATVVAATNAQVTSADLAGCKVRVTWNYTVVGTADSGNLHLDALRLGISYVPTAVTWADAQGIADAALGPYEIGGALYFVARSASKTAKWGMFKSVDSGVTWTLVGGTKSWGSEDVAEHVSAAWGYMGNSSQLESAVVGSSIHCGVYGGLEFFYHRFDTTTDSWVAADRQFIYTQAPVGVGSGMRFGVSDAGDAAFAGLHAAGGYESFIRRMKAGIWQAAVLLTSGQYNVINSGSGPIGVTDNRVFINGHIASPNGPALIILRADNTAGAVVYPDSTNKYPRGVIAKTGGAVEILTQGTGSPYGVWLDSGTDVDAPSLTRTTVTTAETSSVQSVSFRRSLDGYLLAFYESWDGASNDPVLVYQTASGWTRVVVDPDFNKNPTWMVAAVSGRWLHWAYQMSGAGIVYPEPIYIGSYYGYSGSWSAIGAASIHEALADELDSSFAQWTA